MGTPPVISVQEGTSFSRSQSASWAINASLSTNPDRSTLGQSLLQFVWTCLRPTGRLCGDALNHVLLPANLTSVLTFSPNTLQLGTYIFQLTVTSATSAASQNVFVTVVTGTPPVVSISGPNTYVSASNRLELVGSASPSDKLSYNWQVALATVGLDISYLFNLTSQNVLTSVNTPTLVLAPNVMSPCCAYEFTLTATTSDLSSQGYSSFVVNTACALGIGTSTYLIYIQMTHVRNDQYHESQQRIR